MFQTNISALGQHLQFFIFYEFQPFTLLRSPSGQWYEQPRWWAGSDVHLPGEILDTPSDTRLAWLALSAQIWIQSSLLMPLNQKLQKESHCATCRDDSWVGAIGAWVHYYLTVEDRLALALRNVHIFAWDWLGRLWRSATGWYCSNIGLPNSKVQHNVLRIPPQ